MLVQSYPHLNCNHLSKSQTCRTITQRDDGEPLVLLAPAAAPEPLDKSVQEVCHIIDLQEWHSGRLSATKGRVGNKRMFACMFMPETRQQVAHQQSEYALKHSR